MVARAVGAALTVTGAGTAAATGGGTDLTGIAALITAVVGAVALGWSIWQGTRRRRQIDIQTAAELIELLEERRRREGHDED